MLSMKERRLEGMQETGIERPHRETTIQYGLDKVRRLPVLQA